MKKGNYSRYLSSIASMFDLSYPENPPKFSRSSRSIDKSSQKITECAFGMTNTAMKQALSQYESSNQ